MLNLIKRLVSEEEGQGMVEYALIIVLISIVAIVAMEAAGGKVSAIFDKIKTELTFTP